MAKVTTSGIWTGTSLASLKGLNSSQISWGVLPPRQMNPAQRQSGYEFEGVQDATVLLDGTEFTLGTFTHRNFPITGIAQKFTVSLKVALKFDMGGLEKEFNFTFHHYETPNVPGPVPDEVNLPTLQSEETVTIDGTEYAVSISGFRQNDRIVTKFISPENRSNSADIIAKLVAVAKPAGPGKPEIQPPKVPVTEEDCRVKQVVSVSSVFSAMLERLNRRSVVQVLEQVIAEVNKHCEDGPGIKIDLEETKKQIEILNIQLTLIKQSGRELDGNELAQLQELLKKLLLNIDFSTVIQNILINIDGRTFDLRSVVQILATVDQVVTIKYEGSPPTAGHIGDIWRVIFVLTDRTEVTFHIRTIEQQGGLVVKYVFETRDWKGLPAEFSLVFVRQTHTYTLCGRDVTMESFDGLEQTNIVFDLCSKIVKIVQKI